MTLIVSNRQSSLDETPLVEGGFCAHRLAITVFGISSAVTEKKRTPPAAWEYPMLATFLGSTAQPFLTEYRLYTLHADGHIVDVRILRAAADSAAIIKVGRHSGQALELWSGARLVMEFPVRSAFLALGIRSNDPVTCSTARDE
jgi:hypothetical protein